MPQFTHTCIEYTRILCFQKHKHRKLDYAYDLCWSYKCDSVGQTPMVFPDRGQEHPLLCRQMCHHWNFKVGTVCHKCMYMFYSKTLFCQFCKKKKRSKSAMC